MEKLILINPLHLKLVRDGHGEFPDSYSVTEKGLEHIKNYLKETNNEQDTKFYTR